jgi:hypothetical protein
MSKSHIDHLLSRLVRPAKYGLMAVIGLVMLYYLYSVNEKPRGGYLHSVFVQFPADRYTFLVSKKEMAGRTFITDNLWGYRYPSMEPLTPAKRGEFMTAYEHTDWVKVAVLERKNMLTPISISDSMRQRGEKLCFNDSIQRAQTPGNTIFLRGQDVYERKDGRYFGSLQQLAVPNKPEYHDPKKFGPPAFIYWDEGSGNACTLIMCKNYPANIEGQNCQQLYVDTKNALELSMRYDSALLPHWKDIQDKTVAIFNSFSKNEMAQAEAKR